MAARCAVARVVATAAVNNVEPAVGAAACNAVAALVVVELDAAERVERRLGAPFELVVAAPRVFVLALVIAQELEIALAQRAAAEHLPAVALESAGIVEPCRLVAAAAALVLDWLALAGRIGAQLERRLVGRR